MRHLILVGAAALAAAPLSAQSTVVPNVRETTRGGAGLNTLTRDTGNPRTYQIGLPASELTAIPNGAVITGLSFRASLSISNAAQWPPQATTWGDYEISIGAAIPLGTWTGTFGTNFSGTPFMVRDGAMTMPANVYANNSALPAPQANPFGNFFFDFQKPFTYTGGDLAVLFTHPGSNITGALFFDGQASSATTGVAFSAAVFQAPSGGATASFIIPRVHFGYGAGCAGTGGETPVLNVSNNTSGGAGGSIAFGINNGLASSGAVYIFGAGRVSLPLPGGCTLLTNPIVTVPVALDANGQHILPVTVPGGVIGTVDAQAFVLDPNAPGGLVTATNGTSFVAS